MTERLNGEEGLGAIYPAMANAVLMYDALGYPPDHPHLRHGAPVDREAARRRQGRGLLPALPVAGVGHGAHRPCAAGGGGRGRRRAGARGARLARAAPDPRRQGRLGGSASGRAARRLGVPIRQSALSRHSTTPPWWRWRWTAPIAAASPGVRTRIRQRSPAAREWIEGLQSRTAPGPPSTPTTPITISTTFPFADHGALLDPPTADVTARCVSMLAQLGETRETSPVLARGIDALLADQEKDGSWFGRWGMNYIYGTWSALCALRDRRPGSAIGAHAPRRRRGSRGSRIRTAAGARAAAATGSTTRATSPRRAPPRRPPGRCLG